MDVPSDLIERSAEWGELHRWERSELGKDLRRLGLTYGEIRELIPVPKATLSYWCREIGLTEDQVEAIRERTGPDSRRGIPVDTQWRRREEIVQIRDEARLFALDRLDDPFFVAGVVLYWGEGAKTGGDLSLVTLDGVRRMDFDNPHLWRRLTRSEISQREIVQAPVVFHMLELAVARLL